MTKGDRLFDLNKFDEAIKYYDKEMKAGKGKNKSIAREKLANCYRLTNRLEDAEKLYRKIMKKKKKDPVNFLNYGLTLKFLYASVCLQWGKIGGSGLMKYIKTNETFNNICD